MVGGFGARPYVDWLTDLGMFRLGGKKLRRAIMPVRWKRYGLILWGRTKIGIEVAADFSSLGKTFLRTFQNRLLSSLGASCGWECSSRGSLTASGMLWESFLCE